MFVSANNLFSVELKTAGKRILLKHFDQFDHDHDDNRRRQSRERLFRGKSSLVPDFQTKVKKRKRPRMDHHPKSTRILGDGDNDNNDKSTPLLPGLHYVDFFFGNPAQRVTLVVSLSSDYTVFSCSSDCPGSVCNGSGKISFEKSWSESFERLICGNCVSDDAYCEADKCMVDGKLHDPQNTFEIYEATDFVYSGGLIETKFENIEGTDIAVRYGFELSFGCETQSTGFMKTIQKSANGILGLSFGKSSFIHQMFKAGIVTSSFFSMCFHRYSELDNWMLYTSAGTLTFGGFREEYLTTPMVYAMNSRKGSDYSVEITNIYLRDGGGESIVPITDTQIMVKLDFDKDAMNGEYGGVIATSSPITLLNSAVEASFRKQWRRMTGKDYTYEPMDLTVDQLETLPTVIMQFRTSWSENDLVDAEKTVGMVGKKLDPESPFDILLAVPAKNFFNKMPDGKYKSRLSLRNNEGSVLGSNIFQGKYLNFDLISPRIGIAETSQCDKESLGRTWMPTGSPTAVPSRAPIITPSPTLMPTTTSPSVMPSSSPSSSNVIQFQMATTFNFFPMYIVGASVIGCATFLLVVLFFILRSKR
mmetsp:Transcript_14880/g.21300  ORF Transcript_14880/g.21300 Transcript_14880/m.21300 type:complete len:589 (+) Transcript_14880:240-2006(+)|eukprot:CAMPEP_0184870508 /NCGR_PEP_ID=MMETSP0580-20130426/37720_1 /TAXON_ID=1118495 /ORGANISM="Dactyliosolen fragilissimus" /LENGTH=588 /DNA_ID=CAMNT_0027372603 /DNA_START=218 /DNA_END=1984 /DNA_ORIENTATION=-